MKRIKAVPLVLSCLILFAMTLGLSKRAHAQEEKPNVLLIVADDLGFSDLGSYGGEIKTPNLDKLAHKGVRFTQMYNSARCSPSRASLMTGLYPHQSGIGFFAGDRPDNPRGYSGKLQPGTATIAEVLKKSGYQTFMTGKWHIGEPVPTQQGFDEFYGFTHGYASDSWNEDMMIRLPEGASKIDYEDGEFFDTNAFTDYALKFIQESEQENPEKPWFTMISYHAPHFPVQAPDKYINKYKEKYKAGWDQIRQERIDRMKRIGIIDEDTELSPRSSIMRPQMAKANGVPGDLARVPAWTKIPPDRQKDLARRMAVYAGMVDNMDDNVGRLMQHLEKTGQLDNTVILFVSDNGACAEWGPYGFDLSDKQMSTDQPGHGIAVGTPGTPSKLHTGEELEEMGGPEGTGIAYGAGWANVSNTPWSEYKHYTYEGGVSTPFIMHWPEGIKGEKQGSIRDQVSYLFDVTATIYDAAGVTYPESYKGEKLLPIEGKSLLPAVDGQSIAKRPIVYEHSGNGGVRLGKWKLVGKDILNNEGVAEDPVWHLYNIEEDRSEIYDLSKEHPDVVQKMKKLFLDEANRTHILPRPGAKEINKVESEGVDAEN